VVGIASYNQYYTPPVLNVYKQKTPLLGGAYFSSILMDSVLEGDDLKKLRELLTYIVLHLVSY